MKFNVLELFAGAGGMALGLEKSGFEPIALIDNYDNACKTLKKNRPDWNIINEDINKIAKEGISNYVELPENVDLISGGFPCQPFSYAGKKLGLEDVRGTVFYSFAKIIKDVQPKMFVAENVRGLVSHDKGRTLETIINILEESGYKVQNKVLNAWDYGVAQKRQRIFIVGVRKDLDVSYNYPIPVLEENRLVLKDVLKNVPKSEGSKYPENKKKVLKQVPPGGCWRDLPEDVAKEYMGKSYYSGGGRTGMARRLSWDEPSLTLTTSPAQKQTERCHPDEIRPFTTREYARIQSFEDDWIFEGTITHIYRQIGNAVPVELASHIGYSLYKTLYKERKGYTMNTNKYLDFINDDDLIELVDKELASKYREAIKTYNFDKLARNKLDPIKMVVDKIFLDKTDEEIVEEEIIRQRDKTISNAMGIFHQEVFNLIDGWSSVKSGRKYDIKKDDNSIFVEMKNKHNTMNSSSANDLYKSMKKRLEEYPESKYYLVEVISSKSQNEPWVPNQQKYKYSENIRRLSIDQFYKEVTGDELAFKKFCEALPKVINDIIGMNPGYYQIVEDEVLEDVKNNNIDIFEEAIADSFKDYIGF